LGKDEARRSLDVKEREVILGCNKYIARKGGSRPINQVPYQNLLILGWVREVRFFGSR